MDFERIISRVKDFLRQLTPRQQLFLGTSAVVLAGALWFFVRLIDRDDFSTLYSGLSTGDAQALAQQLSARNVSFQLSPDGTSLAVPASQLDALRLELASEGLPQSGRLGFELFDKPNWMGSDFSEKVNYQRALEGELERTIQTLSSVEAVRVHLVMPREALFTEQERMAKAAVVVKLRNGKLAPAEAQAITNLVASAVDQLPPDRVTIVSADGRTQLTPAGSANSAAGNSDLSRRLEEKLLATLTPVAGEGRIRATVFVEFSLASSERTQELYDPATSVVLASQEAEEQRGRSAAAGIPGAASNVPSARPPETLVPAVSRTPEAESSRNATKTFAVNKTVEHVLQPAGDVRRIATAILVDDVIEHVQENGQPAEKRRKRTPEEMQQFQQLAKAAVGYDERRGDQFAVENIAFETFPAEPVASPTKMDQVLEIARQWRGVLRYGALFLLFGLTYLIVLRPIKKQVVATLKDAGGRMGAAATPTPLLAASSAAGALRNGSGEGAAALIESSPQESAATHLKQQLVERVRTEPNGASRLIQNWIRHDEAAK